VRGRDAWAAVRFSNGHEKNPRRILSRAGVANFSMMPLCQCFARRVNPNFSFYEHGYVQSSARSTKEVMKRRIHDNALDPSD
jgi:hypothetical protein